MLNSEIDIRPMGFGPEARDLLAASDLPVEDLEHGSGTLLFGCVSGGMLAGIIGLELHGADALLRSLAVTGAERGSGLGAALVYHVEAQAADRGVRTVYLLTTTAETYFERLGYRLAARDQAPPAIRRSSQFSGLCPSSASFMMKRFDG